MKEQKDSDSLWGPIFTYIFAGAVVIGVIAGVFGLNVLAGICGLIVAILTIIVFGIALINMFSDK